MEPTPAHHFLFLIFRFMWPLRLILWCHGSVQSYRSKYWWTIMDDTIDVLGLITIWLHIFLYYRDKICKNNLRFLVGFLVNSIFVILEGGGLMVNTPLPRIPSKLISFPSTLSGSISSKIIRIQPITSIVRILCHF